MEVILLSRFAHERQLTECEAELVQMVAGEPLPDDVAFRSHFVDRVVEQLRQGETRQRAVGMPGMTPYRCRSCARAGPLRARAGRRSASAGLAGYLRADKRAHRSTLLERLIELTQAARTAESPQMLDVLQAEADKILASTIREVERHTLEERALTAFKLALDQARLAIADRREALLKTMLESSSVQAHRVG